MQQTSKRDIAAYAAYLDDDAMLLRSTSGGAATALAQHMLDCGGYVAGVAYRKDWRGAEYILTNDANDLERLKGSKYIETEKGTIYDDVKELLEAGTPVLFIGLPCTVAALRNFLGKPYEKLVACELICHGPTSAKVHQEYIDFLEEKYQSPLCDFSVRHKDGAWMPSYLYAKFENGEVFQKEFYSTEYGYAFGVMGRPSCYHCLFKGDGRTGDIMVGDFWGATEKDAFWNEKGVSAVLVETQTGFDFLQQTPGLRLFETTFERIVQSNPRVVSSRPETPEREKFGKLFAEKGLFYAAKNAPSIQTRLKRTVKACIPASLVPFAKKVYHLVKK